MRRVLRRRHGPARAVDLCLEDQPLRIGLAVHHGRRKPVVRRRRRHRSRVHRVIRAAIRQRTPRLVQHNMNRPQSTVELYIGRRVHQCVIGCSVGYRLLRRRGKAIGIHVRAAAGGLGNLHHCGLRGLQRLDECVVLLERRRNAARRGRHSRSAQSASRIGRKSRRACLCRGSCRIDSQPAHVNRVDSRLAHGQRDGHLAQLLLQHQQVSGILSVLHLKGSHRARCQGCGKRIARRSRRTRS